LLTGPILNSTYTLGSLGYSEWLPGCCYGVLSRLKHIAISWYVALGGCSEISLLTGRILNSTHTLWSLGYSEWLPGCCYAVSKWPLSVLLSLVEFFCCYVISVLTGQISSDFKGQMTSSSLLDMTWERLLKLASMRLCFVLSSSMQNEYIFLQFVQITNCKQQ